MSQVKERMTEVIQQQPEDSTYDEILRELAFNTMLQRGISDVENNRLISNDEMKKRISSWR